MSFMLFVYLQKKDFLKRVQLDRTHLLTLAWKETLNLLQNFTIPQLSVTYSFFNV